MPPVASKQGGKTSFAADPPGLLATVIPSEASSPLFCQLKKQICSSG
jgi:hypothetical protein